jgi:Fe-S-cluster-containing hydrogenase component 2
MVEIDHNMTHCEPNMPQVDESLCNLCGLCVEACPCGAITMGTKGPVFGVPERCRTSLSCDESAGCSCFYMCEEVCPTGAIACAFEIVSAGDSLENGKPRVSKIDP